MVGRFINADGLIDSGEFDEGAGMIGTNLFAYCANNPIMHKDETGESVTVVIFGVVLTVGQVIAISALLVATVAYTFNFGGFRTTVNKAIAWAIKGSVTNISTILRLFPKLGRWAAGVIARMVAAQIASQAATALPGIARKYGNLKCKEAADAMRKSLQKMKLHGAVISLYFPKAYKGYVMSKRTGGSQAISYNGRHYGILYNSRVYCNIYPEGLPEKQWINQFYDISGSRPIVTKSYF